MKHIKYDKTPQFKGVKMAIEHSSRFSGKDGNGEPIYNNNPLPTVVFQGTIKLHGTNASICYNDKNKIWFQSRNNIVTTGHFNFVSQIQTLSQNDVKDLFDQIKRKYQIDTSKSTICIYGEWAGEGIQSGVGISKFPKTFYIFAIKITSCCNSSQFEPYWVNCTFLNVEKVSPLIRNIHEFTTYKVEVDFNSPQVAFNKMVSYTEAVEASCPVTTDLGIPNQIGEGIVWTGITNIGRFIFKTKGEKHSNSKVKVARQIDIEAVNNVKEFVSNHVTVNRIKQAIVENSLSISTATKRDTGKILKWVVSDVMREEQETIKKSNLNAGMVAKEISNQGRLIYFKLIE